MIECRHQKVSEMLVEGASQYSIASSLGAVKKCWAAFDSLLQRLDYGKVLPSDSMLLY
jgi:hypothetical protein